MSIVRWYFRSVGPLESLELVTEQPKTPGLYGTTYPPFMFVDPDEDNTAWMVAPFKVCCGRFDSCMVRFNEPIRLHLRLNMQTKLCILLEAL